MKDPGSVGDLLVLLSALNWAVFSVLSRNFLKRHRPAPMMLRVMLAGWLMTTALFVGVGNLGSVFRLDFQGWVCVLFLGVFCSGLAYVFWYDALKILPASQAGVLMYLNPLSATLVAVFGLGEPVSTAMVLGAGLISVGAWQVNR